MKRALCVLVAVCTLVLAAPFTSQIASANTILHYTGRHYQWFPPTPPPAPYTSDMFVSAVIVIAGSLPDCPWDGSNSGTQPCDLSPLSFSLSDGAGNISDFDPGVQSDFRFWIENGQILGWQIWAGVSNQYYSRSIYSDNAITDEEPMDVVSYTDFVSGTTGSIGIANHPGSWTTPEPPSFSLLAMGLGLIGFVFLKRFKATTRAGRKNSRTKT